MKEFITNLALFVIFAIAISGLNACNSTLQTASNGNAANANTKTSETKASSFPPLPSGIADAAIELPDGTITKASDHKGKVVLLNLWGVWCGPCREEMPHLAELQAKYGDRGFEVLGLNIGDAAGAPEDFGKIKIAGDQMKINYTLGRIQNESIKQYYLLSRQEAVPQTVLVDRDGRLRGVFVGGGPAVINSISQSVEKAMSE